MILDTICPVTAMITRTFVPDAPLLLPAPRPQLLLMAPKIAGLLMEPTPVKQNKPILSFQAALAERIFAEMYYEAKFTAPDRFAVAVAPSARKWLPGEERHERHGKRRDPRRPVRANVEKFYAVAA